MYPPSTADSWRAELIEWGPRVAIALVIVASMGAVRTQAGRGARSRPTRDP